MKKTRFTTTLLTVILLICLCACQKQPSMPEPLPNASGESFASLENDRITYSYLLAQYPEYTELEALANAATNIYEGVVAGIHFVVLDSKTGRLYEKSDPSAKPNLYTVYEIDVNHTFKGDQLHRRCFKIIGGYADEYQHQQYLTLAEAGLYREDEGIPLLSNLRKLELGKAYLFLTVDGENSYEYVINSTQFALPTDNQSILGGFTCRELQEFLKQRH